MKSVLKEICIAILLCVAALLIFAIVFYDLVPLNKTVPDKMQYSVPNDVKTELAEDLTIQETQPQQITYSVTSEDLRQYESSTVYRPGNPNPFQAYPTGSSNSVITGNGVVSGDGSTTSSNGIQYYYPSTSSSTK